MSVEQIISMFLTVIRMHTLHHGLGLHAATVEHLNNVTFGTSYSQGFIEEFMLGGGGEEGACPPKKMLRNRRS